jgi:hypothetical protein
MREVFGHYPEAQRLIEPLGRRSMKVKVQILRSIVRVSLRSSGS